MVVSLPVGRRRCEAFATGYTGATEDAVDHSGESSVDLSKPARAAKNAAEELAARASDLMQPPVPGAPSSQPPAAAEPTEPVEPLPPKAEQGAPDTRTPTGAETGAPPTSVGQQGAYLTTSTGARVRDTDHSLKAGLRGPTLLQDHHLREKITHFDHERIPERVVHARGAGAHGTFVGYGSAGDLTSAAFLEKDVETPVFVRFSTVAGSRGSADTVRDTRGFAVKFYTDEGTFDLVGNNMPVFFIQDGIKFPDVIHAGKPHPDREIPQAQSAHDTFWDFVSPAHRGHPPRAVEHERPRDPAVLPDHGGLRGAHLPVGERRRRHLPGEIPLETPRRGPF